MASFFQPTGSERGCLNDTRFQVCSNSALSRDELTQHWYQDLVIAVGGSAWILGCLFLVTQFLQKRWRANDNSFWKKSSEGQVTTLRIDTKLSGKVTVQPKAAKSPEPLDSISEASSVGASASFASIVSFGFFDMDDTTIFTKPTSELCIVHLKEIRKVQLEQRVSGGESFSTTSDRSLLSEKPLRPVFGFFDLQDLQSGVLAEMAATQRSKWLNERRRAQGLGGLVLSFNCVVAASAVNDLLQALHIRGIDVIIMCDPDALVFDQINLELVGGMIFTNACILPSGLRRDYFRQARMREGVARCSRQVKARSGFFIGFLEIWDIQPSAATVRRASKLAEFFGAVLEVRPRRSLARSQQSRSREEMCLSGFDWLKRLEIIELQRRWVSQENPVSFTNSPEEELGRLDLPRLRSVIPMIDRLLSIEPLPLDLMTVQNEESLTADAPMYIGSAPARANFWEQTCSGEELSSRGCFELREEITQAKYDLVVRTQRRLKQLNMLHPCLNNEVVELCDSLTSIFTTSRHGHLLQSLVGGLTNGNIRLYKGLDSGFVLPDGGGHLFGVSDPADVGGDDQLDIYVSQKTCNDVTTVWHLFLAHHGVARVRRFEEELLLTQTMKNHTGAMIPMSIQAELDSATDSELLYLLEQLRASSVEHPFANAIMDQSVGLLIEGTSRHAWTDLHSRACLDDSVSMQSLLQTRLEHFAKAGARTLPRIDNLVELYRDLEKSMADALYRADRGVLNILSTALLNVYNSDDVLAVEPNVDLFALMFFCALRKLAFEDVYIDTTDRCPLFLTQHDQAGVFAELWVLGSQCQIYFGILPRALGEIIFDKYRNYLTLNPPSSEAWNGKDVFTAYSNVLPTVRVEGYRASTGSGGSVAIPGTTSGHRPNEPAATMSMRERATKLGALSIFCFPAIVDVCLLTFVGRGFYLTAFMDEEPRLMANYAILASLIMTGGITGWVGSTGGFYLFSFAYDNMTHFLVQLFSASFMLTIVVAFCGFFAFGCEYSWFAGFIFVMYLLALTTFLNLLGIFATMHLLDSPLTSGRIAMWKCMTILFISPILTTFVNGHDLLIYLLVIYTFVIVLLITFRNLCHEWTNWPSKVPTIKEKEVLTWYLSKNPDQETSREKSNSAATSIKARVALRLAVTKYTGQWSVWPFKQAPEDAFVQKMAIGHPFAMWLLEKESGGEELPEMYSTTWFVQLGLALANQQQLVRGLKEHSPFITYRYSEYDLGQNVGLFLGALMDHWISIAMSARNPQALIYFNYRARYGICFGLLYFLAGAVAVDTVLQRYWPYATKLSDQRIKDIGHFDRILRDENRLRKARYRSAVLELLTLLLLIFGVTTVLLWVFVDDHRSIILYFTYISGYTGVIFFQFHRCFTKSPRLHVITVFCCATVGFLVGCILRAVPSTANLFYDYNIGLNAANVPAAIGTFLLTGYFRNPFKKEVQLGKMESQDQHSSSEMSALLQAQAHLTNEVGSPTGSDTSAHLTNVRLMQHLCLGIEVDTQWPHLPEDVRRTILSRVVSIPVPLSLTTKKWLQDKSKDISSEDAEVEKCLANYEEWRITNGKHRASHTPLLTPKDVELSCKLPRGTSFQLPHSAIAHFVVRMISVSVQYTAIISGAGSDIPRELWYALRKNPIRVPVLWLLLKVWKLCWWMKNLFVWVFLIFGKGPVVSMISLARYGAPRTLQASTITVDYPQSKTTGFITRSESSRLSVTLYDGLHISPPEGKKARAIALYDASHRLHEKQDITGTTDGESVLSSYQYNDKVSKRWPVSKTTVESEREIICYYDKYGRVVRGNIFKDSFEFAFELLYKKRPKGNSEVLLATYKCDQPGAPSSILVYWCVQPRGGTENVKQWVPSEKIQRLQINFADKQYDTTWTYQHKQDPVITTVVKDEHGNVSESLNPIEATKDEFGFQKKPKNRSFDMEDVLIYHPTIWLENAARRTSSSPSDSSRLTSRLASLVPFGWSYWSKKTVYRKLSTSVLRSALWTLWGKAKDLDGVTACFVDEMILRQEPLLQRYWRLRDAGYLHGARNLLDENLEQIISAIEPTNESSQTCPLLIKSADLFTMGQGKDANQVTARLEDAYKDTHNRTSVIFSDNGCWPDAPGGVSNCRRDLVNGHTTIRGHCLAESANDYGIPRYQIERNVNSLKILPLWGLDGKTPYHGLLDNLLQTQVDEKISSTHAKTDILEVFVPLLKQFVRGARSRRYTREDLIIYTNVVLKMSRYFEQRDYMKTWNSEEVWYAWVEAWLYNYNDPNVAEISEYLDIEKPSMNDFKSALNLYICYFFIYSVEIPGSCPSVFQSTHHGISSLFGMILKYRRGTTWGIWDHAILWRETCLNISPAQCLLPIPVQAMLLAGIKLACHLAYTHVDVILPCTSVFNPDWEQDLGTDQGLRGSKKLFARKIDPIVNGISNMDEFEPVKEIRSELPTTIMLSNVQFIKDVKNAVLAADVIINKYGFETYRLTVYGAQDRQPSYALETETLITTRKLAGKVVLAGFGSPKEVLKDAWLFMNSSLSEGLPLAIGEAALAGVPIVATEVGATALVLTDPDDPTKRYGEVVPPNDPEALARAQLSLLAMLGPWTNYTTDATPPPPLPDKFTPEDVKWITQRMYDKTADRRALGLKLRAVVLRSFHGHRYLREHEQMYWIQRSMAEQRRGRLRATPEATGIAGFGERNVFTFDAEADEQATGRVRWQEFDLEKLKAGEAPKMEQDKRRVSVGTSEKGIVASS